MTTNWPMAPSVRCAPYFCTLTGDNWNCRSTTIKTAGCRASSEVWFTLPHQQGGGVVTDEQVRLLMSLLKQGIVQVTAAAKAGMSERTARKYVRSGATPSEAKAPHGWRTRVDPFAEVWPEIEALLRQDAGLQAKTVWEELNRRHAGRFSAGQLRTLQRRFLAWRVKSGPTARCSFRRHTCRENKGNRILPTCASSKWSSPASRSRICCITLC